MEDLSGHMLINPVTGVRLLICETAPAHAVLEHFIPPQAGRDPVAHWHTIAAERFEILAGSARYQLSGTEHPASPGDILNFPLRSIHLHPWNVRAAELHLRQTITLTEPDERYVRVHWQFFETLFGLARDGKVDKQGQPNLLQLAVLARSLYPYTYLAGLPVAGQHFLFGTLARLGERKGYRAQYPQYRDNSVANP